MKVFLLVLIAFLSVCSCRKLQILSVDQRHPSERQMLSFIAANRMGHSVLLIGDDTNSSMNLPSRNLAIYKFLTLPSSSHLEDHDLILVTDIMNSFIALPKEEILSRFDLFGTDIVCTAEKMYAYQNPSYKTMYETSQLFPNNGYIYPNTNVFIGTKKALTEMFDEILNNIVHLEKSKNNDLVGTYIARHIGTKKVALDYKRLLFWSIPDDINLIPDSEVEKSILPSVLYVPGSSWPQSDKVTYYLRKCAQMLSAFDCLSQFPGVKQQRKNDLLKLNQDFGVEPIQSSFMSLALDLILKFDPSKKIPHERVIQDRLIQILPKEQNLQIYVSIIDSSNVRVVLRILPVDRRMMVENLLDLRQRVEWINLSKLLKFEGLINRSIVAVFNWKEENKTIHEETPDEIYLRQLISLRTFLYWIFVSLMLLPALLITISYFQNFRKEKNNSQPRNPVIITV